MIGRGQTSWAIAGVEDVFPGVGFYEWRIAEDRLIWSAELTRMYGLSGCPDAEPGFLSLVHPDDRLRVEAETSAFLESGDSYAHEFRIVRPDGGVRLVHDRGVVERDGDGRAAVLRGLNVDVTSVRPAGVDAPDAGPAGRALGDYVLDVKKRSSRWSPDLARLLGRPETEAPPTLEAAIAGVTLADRERVRGEMDAAMRQIGPFCLEYRIEAAPDDIRWVEDHGRTIGPIDPETGLARTVSGTLIDITKRKQAEDRLAEREAQLRLFIEHAPAAMALFDTDMRYVAFSRRYVSDYGLDPDIDLIGRSHYEIFPEVPDHWRVIHQRVLAGAELCQDEETFRRADGREDVLHWSMAPWVRADGTIGGAALFSEVVTARVAERRALAESEGRLAAAVRAGRLGIHDFDPATGHIEWDGTTRELWGVGDDEPVTYETFATGVLPEDLPAVEKAVADALDPAGAGSFEAVYRVANRQTGAIRWVRADGIATFEDGRAARLIGTVCDVTARKQAEQRVQDLLLEVNHRSKNMLTLVQAIARQTARNDDGTFLERFERRLAALAAAQDLLVAKDWGGIPVAELIRNQLDHLGELGERVHLDGPEAILTPEAAQALDMALHELSTNAVKYGALSNNQGAVDLDWQIDPSANRLSISWTERGGPPVSPPSRRGFGTQVISRIVRSSLGGSVDIAYHPEGLAWHLACRAGCLLNS